ncbi:ABC transporter permease [Novosphingobium taihuense]|uniref:Nitrate/nitrite transport system permease protein n=1 Tax=Novosphingobium taihuense TaxID=260085 RepID=A0A7W7ETU6_9SPHN|nr:ABC transporter permease [Novosphingobium taihuense]MBB4613399.1 nitrate/nitrite transport system permease protein [Novosphingobium taihuense]TWH80905.1 nitrate/nitrite transport system permease protein [Novosphingobium taihuense]
MNAVALRKDEFVGTEAEVMEGGAALLPETAAETPVESATKPERALPFGLKLPSGSAAFEALWPPLAGIGGFLALWAVLAPLVQTSLGTLPGPGDVWEAFLGLLDEAAAARIAAVEAVAAGYAYTGPPTFIDQIFTSLETVAAGFVLATLFAVPLGLVAGMSKRVNAAINPLVQVMRPVSPLAWLPIVTMVVSASVTSDDPTLAKSFIISAVVVMLCSLWPTLINTAIGTASIDKDLIAVGRVLRLGWFAKLTRLVLPSSLPYIFTGMRLSLGTGWMVLIAAEMLAQNPGLGKFVWDEFQNGSEKSLARIMVAVVVIGLIGFALDRVMMALQAFVSRNRTV